MTSKAKAGKIGGGLIATAAVFVVFIAVGGAGTGVSAVKQAEKQYGKKIAICHKGKTIKVAKQAWPAHKRHGDQLGTCASTAGKGKGKKPESNTSASNGKGKGHSAGKSGESPGKSGESHGKSGKNGN